MADAPHVVLRKTEGQSRPVILSVTSTSFVSRKEKRPPLRDGRKLPATNDIFISYAREDRPRAETLAGQGGTAGPLEGPAFAAAWTLDGSLGAWADSQVTVDDLDFIIRNTMPRGP